MKTMKELADKTGLTFDGGDDNRLFHEEMVHVYCQILTQEQYDKMENEMNEVNIKGDGYSVYAWNDASGYKYWNKSEDEANYIQVTAEIENISQVDPVKLKRDMDSVFCKLSHWANFDAWYTKQLDKLTDPMKRWGK